MRILLMWILLFPNSIMSQVRVFAGFGGNVYRGEIGANIVREIGLIDFNLKAIRPLGLAGVLVDMSPAHSVGLSIQASSLYGEDRFSNQKDFYRRNWKMNGRLASCEFFYSRKIVGSFQGLIGLGAMINSYEVKDGNGMVVNYKPIENSLSVIIPVGIVWKGDHSSIRFSTSAVLNDNLEGMQMQGSRKCDYFTSLSIIRRFQANSKTRRYGSTNHLITKRGECPTF